MILVVVSSKDAAPEFSKLLDKHGYKHKKLFRRVFCIETTMNEFSLADSPLVASVEPDFEMKPMPQASTVRDDNIKTKNSIPEAAMQSWGRHRIIRRSNPFNRENISVQDVFDLPYYFTRTGVGVDLYHMDQGMDTYHQELAGQVTNIETGETLFQDSLLGDTQGYSYHGTWTGACAYGNTVGIAPNVNVFYLEATVNPGSPVPSFPGGASFLTTFDTLYQLYMSRAATNRPGVVSASYAGYGLLTPTDGEASPAALAGMEDMMDDGLVFVTAAGNAAYDLGNYYAYPAEMHPDIIVVGGTDAYDGLWYDFGGGSCVGEEVTVYAPAHHTVVPNYDPVIKDEYVGNISGTSFATPFTAGVVCCMLEGYQRLTSIEQVRALKNKLIENSTKDVIKDTGAYHPGSVIHNRLLYLDPLVTIENIQGLNKI